MKITSIRQKNKSKDPKLYLGKVSGKHYIVWDKHFYVVETGETIFRSCEEFSQYPRTYISLESITISL